MAFTVDHVTLALGGRAVLRDVSFSIAPGERVVLLGVNGCGKTTLLKALDGLLFAAEGSITYGGEALSAYVACYGAPPDAVFITHVHLDHVSGLERLFIASYFDPARCGRVPRICPVSRVSRGLPGGLR